MIGRGAIVLKRAKNQNELYFVSVWDLACVKSENNALLVEFVKELKPVDTISDAVLKRMQKATCCIHGEKGYHRYASDIIRVISPDDMKPSFFQGEMI